MNRTTALVASALAALVYGSAAPASAQERHDHRPAGAAAGVSGLGAVAFANSGGAAAQAPFQRGLGFLHSFEYDQAAESFRAAQAADPAFAMAFWGEALTYCHLLWGEDDAARRAPGRGAPGDLARGAVGEGRDAARAGVRRGDRGADRRRHAAGTGARIR